MAKNNVNNIERSVDNVLVEAFERLLEARKFQEDTLCNIYEKISGTIDVMKDYPPCNGIRRRKWKAGDYCRAIYSQNDKYYEAQIIYVFRKYCTVEFLGYGNEEKSDYESLIESRGPEARKKQVNEAKEDESEGDERGEVDEHGESGDSDESDNSYQQHNGKQPATVPSAAAYAPPTPPDHLTFIPMPQRSWHPTPPMVHPTPPMMHPTPPMMHPTPPMMHPTPPMMHPTPPMRPPNSITSDPMISSMLTAWYLAGYYTGKFGTGQENPGCRCGSNHSG